ncbi:MAG: hypothetical protein ACREA9_13975 [Pyrinomonadaceae bacterium]
MSVLQNNSNTNAENTEWKWCAAAAAAIMLLALTPQIHFWYVRGANWNGAYASVQGDEFLYSAYINALIDGRPRRNDPFAGQDNRPTSPLPESSFSIQFMPAYAIAIPSRVLGVSASTAFILLEGAVGLLASLSIFWLLASVTKDSRFAAAGVFVVLCLGELAGDQGILGVLLFDHKLSVFMPFLRRYQPAAVFPVFLFLYTLVWRALTLKDKRRARLNSVLAGVILGVLMFSYLYFWTAAVAWLTCVAVLWLWLGPRADRRRSMELLTIIAAIGVLALIPYVYLVSHRSSSQDDATILVLTHQPDLFHPPELIGAFILVALIVGLWRRKFKLSEPGVIFAASFGLLPFLLFNQQVLTGRSMQPFHFDLFVANYCVLVGLAILIPLFWQHISNRTLVWIAAFCFSWGIAEVSLLAIARTAANTLEDEMVPVLLRLKELSKEDGTITGLEDSGKAKAIAFSPQADVMRLLPTWTAQGTLLTAGAQDFGSASRRERKELLFMQLYYSDANAERFRALLNQKTDDSYMNFFAPSVIFGDERFIPVLSLHPRPIAPEEIEEEVRAYQAYSDSFSRENVGRRPLSYLIMFADREINLSRLDRWYARDAGERVGAYTLYRLQLRQ